MKQALGIDAPQLASLLENVFFVLDPWGRFRYLSTMESSSGDGAGLIGQPISRLVPALPLREKTPGYNIAFARFSFAGDRWQSYDVRMPDATLLPAKICLWPLLIGHGHCLLGLMRLFNKPDGATNAPPGPEKRQKDRRAPMPTRLAL